MSSVLADATLAEAVEVEAPVELGPPEVEATAAEDKDCLLSASRSSSLHLDAAVPASVSFKEELGNDAWDNEEDDFIDGLTLVVDGK